jgi:hypothetical protein
LPSDGSIFFSPPRRCSTNPTEVIEMKYVVKFWIPIDIGWDVWDQEIYEFWTLEEAMEKIRKRRYRDPYTVYKLIDKPIDEYDELESALKQKPKDVTVTLKVDTARLDQKELDILVSLLLKGTEIKVTIDGTKIFDLQSLLDLAKKAELFNARIDITDDVYNQLSD